MITYIMPAWSEPGLDALLALDGTTFFVDDEGNYQVRFVAKKVEVTPERPHGLMYSLVLLGKDGERLVGFDNAHSVAGRSGPAGRRGPRYDHRHRLRTVRPYEYEDAASLLSDFWEQVDAILKERGVLP
jgi:hypothetical protein